VTRRKLDNYGIAVRLPDEMKADHNVLIYPRFYKAEATGSGRYIKLTIQLHTLERL
jgi:hypothetical protein